VNAAGQDEFIPTRHSLLSRLRDWDDQEGWREFFDTYWKFLYAVAVKAGLSDVDAQDVVQDTVVAVARGLREKRFRATAGGSFKAWLKLIVQRRVVDLLRRRRSRPDHDAPDLLNTDHAAELEAIVDPAAETVAEIWDQEWARNLADAAMERVKKRIGTKQFQMFDLYVLKQWPVRTVAQTLHVNVAQVYLAKHRITALVKKETTFLRNQMES